MKVTYTGDTLEVQHGLHLTKNKEYTVYGIQFTRLEGTMFSLEELQVPGTETDLYFSARHFCTPEKKFPDVVYAKEGTTAARIFARRRLRLTDLRSFGDVEFVRCVADGANIYSPYLPLGQFYN